MNPTRSPLAQADAGAPMASEGSPPPSHGPGADKPRRGRHSARPPLEEPVVLSLRALISERTGLHLHAAWVPPRPATRLGGLLLLCPHAPGKPLPREMQPACQSWLERLSATDSGLLRSGHRVVETSGLARVCLPVPSGNDNNLPRFVVFQARVHDGPSARAGDPSHDTIPTEAPADPDTRPCPLASLPASVFRSAEQMLRRQLHAWDAKTRGTHPRRPVTGEAATAGPKAEAAPHRPSRNGEHVTTEAVPFPPPRVGRRAQRLVEQVRAYLHENFSRRLTLNDLAGAMSLNPAYISSLFSRAAGTTIHRYLEEIRMAKAKELLRDPKARIGEVALGVGFASADAFRHAFKAYTGVSPSDWR